ncbi:osmotically inducible protein OsmC [Bacillus sp. FJAT-18017]|uniref:sulfurtransferase TusA family protein n=1 Tax=Bacillus sp. FJAT-18017 TaxID=1705566 RepID=UPI0006B039CC|nr:OsmC family protein [Bacillus sp. FJAT-18017]ALC92534.1 osmotically inducible protein OsmC [Bacillus sp. FJAT-18017]
MENPKAVCDGGDLDCGSGLLLIIKKAMDPLENAEVLEVRSRERTVAEDLPAWCRMVDHAFLGSEQGDNTTRYFIRKGSQQEELVSDLEAAKGYKWNVRVQGEKSLTAKVHSRNHTFKAGQPADFSPKVDAPSAIDYLLGALASDLAVGFKAQASRRNIEIDQLEVSIKAGLGNVLFHLELEDGGSPAIQEISGTFYVSSPKLEEELERLWETTLERSPIYQTLTQSININIQFKIVY